jgi:hypothetical protein
VCATARDILGDDRFRLDFHVARRGTDMEVLTPTRAPAAFQSLIVGRDVTGLLAFN